MSKIETAEQYCQAVLADKIPACEFIHLACQRRVNDLHRAAVGDVRFPYYFDAAAVQRVVDFCHLLKPSKGEWGGKPLRLLPWQLFVLGELFGWLRREDDTRRYRIAYIEVPRKNGKSSLLAVVGLYMLCADGEPGAEVYSAATSRDQARQIFDEAVAMRDNSLKQYVQKTGKKECGALLVAATRSKFKALASDTSKLDGLNVHCALVDELHEHADKAVWEKLKTATGSRRQALLIGITTAGVGQESFCYSQRKIAERLLKRDSENDNYFAFISCADDESKWDDEAQWWKANPSLGYNLKMNVVREACQLAKESPDELNDFLRYHLNIWTEKLRVWMPMDKWAAPACMGTDEEYPDPKIIRAQLLEKLKGRICVAAVDLAATIDITACVLVFPPKDDADKWYVIPYFWFPENNISTRVKRDHVRYDVWAREGFITTTPGNACESKPVHLLLAELAKEYDIREVIFDDWGAQDFVNDAQGAGFTVVKFREGFKSLSPPTKELLKLVLKGQLVHGGNPVLRWMASNVVVDQDAAGNIKPNKDRSAEKIDGIVATIMALSAAERYKQAAAPEMFLL